MGVNSWSQHAGLGIDVATAENARILIRMAQAIKRMLNVRRLDSFPEIPACGWQRCLCPTCLAVIGWQPIRI